MESDSMDSKPLPPPEAALIRVARKAAGLTVAEAARLAGESMARGISVSRWSQIENGYEVRAGGEVRRVDAEPGMLAHMARVTGVSPARLRETGRDNAAAAAEILAEIIRRQQDGPPPAGPRLVREPPPGFPPADPETFADMAEYLDETDIRRERARRAHPGERLTGQMVFPRSPADADLWDRLAGQFGGPEDGIAWMFSAWRAYDKQQERADAERNRHAAGLILA